MTINIRLTKVEVGMLKELQKKDKRHNKELKVIGDLRCDRGLHRLTM